MASLYQPPNQVGSVIYHQCGGEVQWHNGVEEWRKFEMTLVKKTDGASKQVKTVQRWRGAN